LFKNGNVLYCLKDCLDVFRPVQKDLPPECADFTAGLCNPNADEKVDEYDLPSTPDSNAICQVRNNITKKALIYFCY